MDKPFRPEINDIEYEFDVIKRLSGMKREVERFPSCKRKEALISCLEALLNEPHMSEQVLVQHADILASADRLILTLDKLKEEISQSETTVASLRYDLANPPLVEARRTKMTRTYIWFIVLGLFGISYLILQLW